jgi:hypothetical protein
MKSLIAAVCSGLIFAVAAANAEPVASVVAVRGKAAVERGTQKLDAQPKLGIELQDTVATLEAGRVKLLFIDDSVLTLAEKSRMSIATFIHSRSDRGKSLFNLLDGKMRAVVGKTKFEVKTPTVVAAARGTVILFEVGTLDGRAFTRVTCQEGIVDVRRLEDSEGKATVMLSAGETILVMGGQPTSRHISPEKAEKTTQPLISPTDAEKTPQPGGSPDEGEKQMQMPLPTRLSPAEIEELLRDTSTSGTEIKLPDTVLREAISGKAGVTPIPVVPKFTSQQPPTPKPGKVNIGVNF